MVRQQGLDLSSCGYPGLPGCPPQLLRVVPFPKATHRLKPRSGWRCWGGLTCPAWGGCPQPGRASHGIGEALLGVPTLPVHVAGFVPPETGFFSPENSFFFLFPSSKQGTCVLLFLFFFFFCERRRRFGTELRGRACSAWLRVFCRSLARCEHHSKFLRAVWISPPRLSTTSLGNARV